MFTFRWLIDLGRKLKSATKATVPLSHLALIFACLFCSSSSLFLFSSASFSSLSFLILSSSFFLLYSAICGLRASFVSNKLPSSHHPFHFTSTLNMCFFYFLESKRQSQFRHLRHIFSSLTTPSPTLNEHLLHIPQTSLLRLKLRQFRQVFNSLPIPSPTANTQHVLRSLVPLEHLRSQRDRLQRLQV